MERIHNVNYIFGMQVTKFIRVYGKANLYYIYFSLSLIKTSFIFVHFHKFYMPSTRNKNSHIDDFQWYVGL